MHVALQLLVFSGTQQLHSTCWNMSLVLDNYFLPKAYDLALTLSSAKPNYSGKVSIQLIKNDRYSGSNTSDSSDSTFSLTLNTAEVVSIGATLKSGSVSWKLKSTLNKTAQTTTYCSEDVKVAELGDDLVIEINFLAVIRKIMTYNDVTKGVFSTKYTDPTTGKSDLFLLSTHSQPHFARYIFPCVDDINCKCEITLTLTVDNAYTCVSNLPIESSDFVSESSDKIVKFIKSPPMTTSVFSFAVGNLEFIEQIVDMPVTEGKMPVRVYTMVGESERASFALSTVSKAIVELESKFGVAYPLPKLDIMAIPFLSDGGVENWSMIQVINDHILLPDWKVSDKQLAQLKRTITDVLVHEIVHMYVGNFITFDSYDHTWMNESFATFMSNTIINSLFDKNHWAKTLNAELTPLKNRNMTIDAEPILIMNVKSDRIHDTFSRNSYDKGIFVMRMLASLFVDDAQHLDAENYDSFFSAIGEFITKNKYGNFKPVDLWNFLKSHSSNKFGYDIPTIMNSWIRTPGFPRLTISKQDDNTFKLEQHRCLDDPEQIAEIEDIPFQLPLLFKNSDGKLSRQLMTDRTLVIEEESVLDDFLFINANAAAIVDVTYPETVAKAIAGNFNALNKVEQILFFREFSSTLGTHYQTNETVVSFFKSIRAIKKANRVDKTAMAFGISILSNVYKSINTLAYFEDKKLYKRVNIFVDELVNKYISQFEWDDVEYAKLSAEELKLRSEILSLKSDNHTAHLIGAKLFKKLLHGPKESVPVEFLSSVLTIVAQNCSLKEYKDISKLVRNPGLVVNNIICGTDNDVQTAAINALGFMNDAELRYKTLNFVNTNPDIKMIELALLGFRFQMAAYNELWKWYTSNYTTWYSRYSRDKESYQGLYFKHVSQLAMECACYDPSLRKEVEKFAASRNEALKSWYEEALGKVESIKLLNAANSELMVAI